jgi:MFS family permease
VNQHEAQDSASVTSLLTPARKSTTLFIWCAFFFAFLVVYFISSWMPQNLSAAGLSQQQAIQGTTALPLGAIVGNILIGWLARHWRLGRVITIAFVIGAAGMVLLGSIQSEIKTVPFILIWIFLFATGISLLGAFGNLYNVAMLVYPVQIRGTGLGWAAGLGRAGAVASPTLAGLLVAAGLSPPSLFFLFAVPAIVSAWTVSLIRVRELP